MMLFNKDRFDLLKSKVIEGQASPEEYEQYREMLKAKEEAQQKAELLSKKLEEINSKVRELKNEKEQIERELQEIYMTYGLIVQPETRRRRSTVDTSFINQDIKRFAFGYSSWYRKQDTIYAKLISRRSGQVYDHNCPILHFQTILNLLLEELREKDSVSAKGIGKELEGNDLGDGTLFYWRGFKHRIAVTLSVLEQLGFIRRTNIGRRSPKFSLNASEEEIWNSFKEQILEPWLKEMLEKEQYKAILSLQGKIPENQTIKGIFLAARAKL